MRLPSFGIPCLGFGWYLAQLPLSTDLIHLEEARLVAPTWSEKRVDSFVMGRLAAHKALSRLVGSSAPVLKGSCGEPIWPAGLLGSISHKEGIAVAAVGHTKDFFAIGIDIEDCQSSISLEGAKCFCTQEEIQEIRQEKLNPIKIFSLKEAYLKAYFSAYGSFPDIQKFNVLNNEKKNWDIMYRYTGKYIVSLCFINNKSD